MLQKERKIEELRLVRKPQRAQPLLDRVRSQATLVPNQGIKGVLLDGNLYNAANKQDGEISLRRENQDRLKSNSTHYTASDRMDQAALNDYFEQQLGNTPMRSPEQITGPYRRKFVGVRLSVLQQMSAAR